MLHSHPPIRETSIRKKVDVQNVRLQNVRLQNVRLQNVRLQISIKRRLITKPLPSY